MQEVRQADQRLSYLPWIRPCAWQSVHHLQREREGVQQRTREALAVTDSAEVMEASLLRYLVEREGTAVSRRAMLEHVWGLRDDTDTRAIDNFIVRLRKYIEEAPANPRHLLTVRGVGYKFVASPVRAKSAR